MSIILLVFLSSTERCIVLYILFFAVTYFTVQGRYFNMNYPFLARLRWKLKWAILFTCCLPSVCLSVCLWTFYIFDFFTKTTGQITTKLAHRIIGLKVKQKLTWELKRTLLSCKGRKLRNNIFSFKYSSQKPISRTCQLLGGGIIRKC